MPRYESVGDTTRAWRRLRAFLEADESVSSAALIEAACDALETSTVDGATCVPIIAALREARAADAHHAQALRTALCFARAALVDPTIRLLPQIDAALTAHAAHLKAGDDK